MLGAAVPFWGSSDLWLSSNLVLGLQLPACHLDGHWHSKALVRLPKDDSPKLGMLFLAAHQSVGSGHLVALMRFRLPHAQDYAEMREEFMAGLEDRRYLTIAEARKGAPKVPPPFPPAHALPTHIQDDNTGHLLPATAPVS